MLPIGIGQLLGSCRWFASSWSEVRSTRNVLLQETRHLFVRMNSLPNQPSNTRQVGVCAERGSMPSSSVVEGSGDAPDESMQGPKMLQKIVGGLRKKGVTFILPLSDQNAMVAIVEPLHNLVHAGVRPEFVIDTCVQRPHLLSAFAKRGDRAFAVIETIVDNCAMTFEDAIRIFATYADELLNVELETVQGRLNVVLGCSVLGHALGRTVRKCPALLFASTPKCMGVIAENLSGFFSRRQISRMVANIPQILLGNIEELESKYEYINFHMCIEESEFGICERWVDMPLEEIMMRHDFLRRTGAYTTPNPKRPQFKMENPSLKQILDTPDSNFATEVANVTLEDWLIFKGLTDKINRQVGTERPFERIKPSMRKAFERRRKEAPHKAVYALDGNAADCC